MLIGLGCQERVNKKNDSPYAITWCLVYMHEVCLQANSYLI